jgi:hypothetical protein
MGCVARLDGLREEVQYWVTRRDLGGVAVITRWGGDTATSGGVNTWSLVAWAGPFKGSETLTAPFDPHACSETTGAVTTAAIDASIATREQAQASFVDSLRDRYVDQGAIERANMAAADAPAACDNPEPSGAPVATYDLYSFSIELPADFVLADREQMDSSDRRSGQAHYEWRAADGSTATVDARSGHAVHEGLFGMIKTECDTSVVGQPAHFDVGNASVRYPRLTVGATYRTGGSSLGFMGVGRSPTRQRELLRAAYLIRLNSRWGKREGDR